MEEQDDGLSDRLKAVAAELGISFKTAVKVHDAIEKNWRNAVVHGVHIREQIEDGLGLQTSEPN